MNLIHQTKFESEIYLIMNNISAILSSYGILHSPSARYHPQRAKSSLSGNNNMVFITGFHTFCAMCII